MEWHVDSLNAAVWVDKITLMHVDSYIAACDIVESHHAEPWTHELAVAAHIEGSHARTLLRCPHLCMTTNIFVNTTVVH